MTTATKPLGTARCTLLAMAPAVLLLLLQVPWPWPFFSDDSFISLRYADRLLDGHGLTWTDGERVEGYSNLLWVLLCAALHAVGLELVTAARALGAVCTVATMWLLAWAQRPHDARSTIAASLPPLLVASTQTVLVWTLAGLEGPLVMMLLAWGFGSLLRQLSDELGPEPATWSRGTLLRLGAPFAIACLVRPDSPIWALTVGVALGAICWRRGALVAATRALWFGMLPAAVTLLQLLFRLAYYGDFVPNTAHVKAELSLSSLAPGFAYVQSALATVPGLTVASSIGLLLLLTQRRTRGVLVLLLLPTIAWLVYLTVIGGDHFPGRRLLHGALVPLALLSAGVAARGSASLRTLVSLLVTMPASIANVYVARSDARSLEARAETWEWYGKSLGEVLQRALHDRQPRLAVDAAGSVPFYSELPALDMLGLCDRTIATTPFRPWLSTMRSEIPRPPGHLRGNGGYVLDRGPDLMLFSSPPGLPLPVFVSGAEIEEDARFAENHRCVLLEIDRQQRATPLWVRLDGKVGVQLDAARIEIPGWLFGSYRLPEPLIRRHQPPSSDVAAEARVGQHMAAIAQWYGARHAVAVARANDGALELSWRSGPAPEFELSIPAGNWRIVEPEDAALLLVVSRPMSVTGNGFRVQDRDATVLRLGGDATVTPVHLHRVVLQRLPD